MATMRHGHSSKIHDQARSHYKQLFCPIGHPIYSDHSIQSAITYYDPSALNQLRNTRTNIKWGAHIQCPQFYDCNTMMPKWRAWSVLIIAFIVIGCDQRQNLLLIRLIHTIKASDHHATTSSPTTTVTSAIHQKLNSELNVQLLTTVRASHWPAASWTLITWPDTHYEDQRLVGLVCIVY